MTRLALLEGDGVGPEVVGCAARVLAALVPDVGLVHGAIGLGAWERGGEPLPRATVELVASCDAALLGAVTTPPRVEGYRSPVLGLRRRLGLWANLRPARSIPCPASRPDVDLVVVRENTEGLYSGRERREDGGDTAVTERVITRAASERILRRAFELARARPRRHVTVVHKANVLRETCGLFLEAADTVSADFPDVGRDDALVDSCATRLVLEPSAFDVICTTNLFGDVLSDLTAGLVGGLGVAASANVGDAAAVFEPVHGSAPDIAGRGIANPVATLRAAAAMLDHVGRREEGARLAAAVESAIEAGETTADLGGRLGTDEVGEAVLRRLAD